MEGSPVQLVMQNVPELIVHERVSQGIGEAKKRTKYRDSLWKK